MKGFPLVALAAAATMTVAVRAQVAKPAENNITPVYEGWLPRDDGSFDLVFGYFNRAWDEASTIPIGPSNTMEPGADRGQPTHFQPRRNRFVFTVHVPANFGKQEIVWTLTSRGRTEKAYGTLKPDYVLDDTVIMSNIGAGGALSTSPDMVGNKPPELTIEGPKNVTAKVGVPITLAATATDDGKPNKRNMPNGLGGNYILPQSANGLRLSFFVYRGAGKAVTFDPPQTEVWEDTRDGGRSPWSAGFVVPPIPDANRWTARVTFAEPGDYVIRALAHDGGLFTSRDIAVSVSR
jgi:hypothetical protein